MQTVAVDAVTFCGPRQFGWSDTGSALNTLISWLCHSNPFDVGGRVQLDCGRVRQFAKTIIGGMCRSSNSYEKANDGALGPLEDWLRQSFMVATEAFPWEYPDKDGDEHAFITLEDWRMIRMGRAGNSSSRGWMDYAHTDVPQYPEDDSEWLQEVLLTRVGPEMQP